MSWRCKFGGAGFREVKSMQTTLFFVGSKVHDKAMLWSFELNRYLMNCSWANYILIAVQTLAHSMQKHSYTYRALAIAL